MLVSLGWRKSMVVNINFRYIGFGKWFIFVFLLYGGIFKNGVSFLVEIMFFLLVIVFLIWLLLLIIIDLYISLVFFNVKINMDLLIKLLGY